MLYWFFRDLSLLLFKILFRIKAVGEENIPREGGFILASNHRSFLDPIAVGSVCPRGLNFMARHDLFKGFLGRQFMLSLRAFPVKRDSADFSALKEAIRRVRSGGGLLVFPEGTRQAEGFGKPHPGIGFLAAKLNVPVIPAYVQGTDLAMPKGAKFIRPVKVSVYFGKEISIEGRLPYEDIAQEVMQGIRRLSCQL